MEKQKQLSLYGMKSRQDDLKKTVRTLERWLRLKDQTMKVQILSHRAQIKETDVLYCEFHSIANLTIQV